MADIRETFSGNAAKYLCLSEKICRQKVLVPYGFCCAAAVLILTLVKWAYEMKKGNTKVCQKPLCSQ